MCQYIAYTHAYMSAHEHVYAHAHARVDTVSMPAQKFDIAELMQIMNRERARRVTEVRARARLRTLANACAACMQNRPEMYNDDDEK